MPSLPPAPNQPPGFSFGSAGDRRLPLAALALTVLLGLISRRVPLGLPLWDKSLGDALYAVAVYWTLALLRPQAQPLRRGTVALGICTAVELLSLTGLPARYGKIALVRYLLGTTFSLHDLACYAVGIAVVTGLDAWRQKRRRHEG